MKSFLAYNYSFFYSAQRFLTVIFFITCTVQSIAAQEIKFEPFKNKQEVEKLTPTMSKAIENERKAYEFKERYESTRKAFEEEINKKKQELESENISVTEDIIISRLIVDKNNALQKTQTSESITDLQEQISQLQALSTAHSILKEPLLQELVKSYQEALAKTAEQVMPEQTTSLSPEELPLSEISLLNKLKILFNKAKIWVHDFFGNTERVISVRKNLDAIYEQLGSSFVLEKARNNKELARIVQGLRERIDHHRDALSEYEIALKVKSESIDQEKIVNEVQKTVADLIQLREELNAEELQELKSDIDTEISRTFKAFDLSQERIDEIEKTAQEQRLQEITALRESIEKRRDQAVQEWISVLDTNAQKKLKEFNNDIIQLAERSIDNLPLEQQVLIKGTVHNAFGQIASALHDQLIFNPELNTASRVLVWDSFLRFIHNYTLAAKEFNQRYTQYLQKERVTGSPTDPLLPVNYAETVASKLRLRVQAYKKQLSQELFDGFINALTSVENTLARSAVSVTSFQAAQQALEQAHEAIRAITQKGAETTTQDAQNFARLAQEVQNINLLLTSLQLAPLDVNMQTGDVTISLPTNQTEIPVQSIAENNRQELEQAVSDIPIPPPPPPSPEIVQALENATKKVEKKVQVVTTNPSQPPANKPPVEVLKNSASKLKKVTQETRSTKKSVPAPDLAGILERALKDRRVVIEEEPDVYSSQKDDEEWD